MITLTFLAKASSFSITGDLWGETFLYGHIEELSDCVDKVLRLQRQIAKVKNKVVKQTTVGSLGSFSTLELSFLINKPGTKVIVLAVMTGVPALQDCFQLYMKIIYISMYSGTWQTDH